MLTREMNFRVAVSLHDAERVPVSLDLYERRNPVLRINHLSYVGSGLPNAPRAKFLRTVPFSPSVQPAPLSNPFLVQYLLHLGVAEHDVAQHVGVVEQPLRTKPRKTETQETTRLCDSRGGERGERGHKNSAILAALAFGGTTSDVHTQDFLLIDVPWKL